MTMKVKRFYVNKCLVSVYLLWI